MLEEIGAGGYEFVFTSSARLLMNSEHDDNIITPEKVCYITLTRSKDDIMQEIAFSFPDYYDILRDSITENRLEFKDFSQAYFASSFIPTKWILNEASDSFESLKWKQEEKNLIEALVEYLDENADSSMVIIDSLTSLIQYCIQRIEWNDLILFLRGLQKASKKWMGIVYMLLNGKIFDTNKQEEIAECMDGVVVFEWEKNSFPQRQRLMYIKKFRGIMPTLEHEDIVNFETQITSVKGFEISNVKRVRGR